MSDHGHYRTSRKALQPVANGGDIFWNEAREFSRWEAWEYLYGDAARWVAQPWSLRSGEVIQLARGETKPLSARYLEQRWGWGKNACNRFLALLKKMNRIAVQQETPDGYTYLIVNYELYQGDRDSGGTAKGTAAGQRRDSGGTKDKKEKKENRESRAKGFPKNFAPTPEHVTIALSRGADVHLEVEKCRDWARSKGIKRLDWTATFRNWLRRIEKPKNGKANGIHLRPAELRARTPVEAVQGKTRMQVEHELRSGAA